MKKVLLLLLFLTGSVFASELNVLRGYKDTTGTVQAFKSVDGKPRISCMPYTFDISEGNVSGHEAWSKIGFTPTMTTSENDLWSKAGIYTFPTVSTSMAVVSSSADDTLAGTGAQIVTIYYLDDTWTSKTSTVALSGLAYSTATPTNIYRINGFRVTSAGTGCKAAGNISLVDLTTKAITYGYITAGFTRARNSVYTVPANKTLYIVAGAVSYGYATNQTHYARISIKVTENEGVRTPCIFYPAWETVVSNSSASTPEVIPFKVSEKVDLKVSGISTFTGTAVSYFEGWLE